ncbi:MAG: hypothetical protein F6K42_12380 [Leptolyngbya sp. SIO1D8]|nr:hypothetical protein [Leptolyngbya sp. SIO1D8]
MDPFPLPDDLQFLAAGYVMGDLSSEEMVQFQQLLMNHPELAQMVASLQETLSMLPAGLPPQHPNPQVKTNLLAAAKVQSNSQKLPRLKSVIKSRRFLWPTRIAASVAIGLAGCSVWLGYRVVTLQSRLAMAEHFVEVAIADKSATDPDLTVSSADVLLTQQWSGLAQMVQDHLKSVMRSQGPVDVATADPDILLAQLSLSEQIPMLASPEAKLLGGSRCQFGKAQGLRLTYQLPAEQTLSVYQIDLNGNQFPEFSGTYVTLRHHDVNLILWREANHLYALAAEMPLANLQTLAKTMELI